MAFTKIAAAGICVKLAADPSESNTSPAELGNVTVALLAAAGGAISI